MGVVLTEEAAADVLVAEAAAVSLEGTLSDVAGAAELVLPLLLLLLLVAAACEVGAGSSEVGAGSSVVEAGGAAEDAGGALDAGGADDGSGLRPALLGAARGGAQHCRHGQPRGARHRSGRRSRRSTGA